MTGSSELISTFPQASYWEARVQQWAKSGKSAYAWCRENKIPYHQFISWRRRFTHLTYQPTVSFVELPQSDRNESGLRIEIGGAIIHLETHFNEEDLFKCLQVMKRQ